MENRVIRQFVDVIPMVWKPGSQLLADFANGFYKPFDKRLLGKMPGQHTADALPEYLGDFFMDALVTQYGELPILERNVEQHPIPVFRLFHFQFGKRLDCPLQGRLAMCVLFKIDAHLT